MYDKRQDTTRYTRKSSGHGRFLRPWLEVVVVSCLLAIFISEITRMIPASPVSGPALSEKYFQYIKDSQVSQSGISPKVLKCAVVNSGEKAMVSSSVVALAVPCVYSVEVPEKLLEAGVKPASFEGNSLLLPISFQLQ